MTTSEVLLQVVLPVAMMALVAFVGLLLARRILKREGGWKT